MHACMLAYVRALLSCYVMDGARVRGEGQGSAPGEAQSLLVLILIHAENETIEVRFE